MPVTLPSDAELGPIPAANYSRPIASVDTTAIGQGVQKLGQGVQQLGQGVTAYADRQKSAQDTLDEAKATASYLSGRATLDDETKSLTDPDEIDKQTPKYASNLDAAAGLIQDPQKQQLFRLRYTPDVTKAGVEVSDHSDNQASDQQKADFVNTLGDLSRSAATVKDPALVTKGIDTINGSIQKMQADGHLTAVEAAQLRQKSISSYLGTAANGVQDPAERLNLFRAAPQSKDDTLDRIGNAESGGVPTQRAKTSSALGTFQFVKGTWAQELAKARPDLVQGRSIAELTNDPQIQALRTDPTISRQVASQYYDTISDALKQAGVAATPANLSLAWFVGEGAAPKIIKADPNTPVANLVGQDAVAANPSVLAGKSAGSVLAWAAGRMGGVGPQGNSYTKMMTGDDQTQIITASRQQLAQQQKQALQADALTSKAIGDAQSSVVAGNDPGDQVWNDLATKAAGAQDPNVRNDLATAQTIRGTLAALKGQPPQVVAAQAQALAAHTAALPQSADPMVIDRAHTINDAVQKYATSLAQDVQKDPVGRAVRDGVIGQTPALDPSSPDFAQNLHVRAVQAVAAAQTYHQPVQYLQPAEKKVFADIAAKGGPQMIQAAQSVVDALGPQTDSFLREVGGDAPKFATAARVAAWGGSPAFLQDFAQRQAINSDPSKAKALELPQQNASDAIASDVLGNSLSASPAMAAAVKQSARDVYEVRALRDGLDKQIGTTQATETMRRTVQEAAGATFVGNTQFGGAADYKPPGNWLGTQKILAPLAMRADSVRAAMGALTEADMGAMKAPPVAGDGKTPIPVSQLQKGNLVSQGHGVYWVALGNPAGKDPQWVMAPDGKKFTLDLNAVEPALRQRVPQAYSAGPGS